MCIRDRLSRTLVEGVERFDRMIPGFGRPDALLAGVESRTSSPLRIVRGESLESSVKGLYPCLLYTSILKLPAQLGYTK